MSFFNRPLSQAYKNKILMINRICSLLEADVLALYGF